MDREKVEDWLSPQKGALEEIVVVELAGPGGTGKSAVAKKLARKGHSVVRVAGKRDVMARLRATHVAVRFAFRHRLSPSQAVSLFRKCASVETGLSMLTQLPAGTHIVDEGPIRTLRDTRCRSWRERAAWWDYGRQVLERIGQGGIPILIVDLRLDEAARSQRYRAREQESARMRQPPLLKRMADRVTRRRSPAPIPTIRYGIRIFAASRLSHLVHEERLQVSPQDSPADVTARIIPLLNAQGTQRKESEPAA